MRKAFQTLIVVLAASMFLVPRTSAGLFSHTPSIERYTGPDAGRVVISLAGYRGANFSHYWLYFRTQDKTKSDSLDYACGGTLSCQGLFGLGSLSEPNTDSVDNIEAGNVFVLPLAPGNYEFYDFQIFYNNGYVQSTFRSKVEFSIPFTIEPGKTVYLGEFRAMDITGQNLFGIPIAAGAKFQIFDKSTRDLAIAKRKDPAVSGMEIRIPDTAKIGSPFFDRLQ